MQKIIFEGQVSSAAAHFKADVSGNGFLASVLNRFANRVRRSKLTSLDELEDHMLMDIGITRQDLGWARDLPLNRNPLAALDELTRQRSHARHMSGVRDIPGKKIR